jgi:V8-like Glu-specific endopeptidase
MKNSSLALVTITALAGFVTEATATQHSPRVILGTDVTQQEYANFDSMVHIETSAGRCGAQLLAGEWILTARHCLPIEYEANDGDSADIKIYRGLKKFQIDNLIYNGEVTMYGNERDEIAQGEYMREVYTDKIHDRLVAANYARIGRGSGNGYVIYEEFFGEDARSSEETNQSNIHPDKPIYWWHYSYDLAIGKLDHPISYKYTAPLQNGLKELDEIQEGGYIDHSEVTDLFNIKSGDTFTFMGWGSGGPNENTVNTLRKIPIEVNAAEFTFECNYQLFYKAGGSFEEDCSDIAYEDLNPDDLMDDINKYMKIRYLGYMTTVQTSQAAYSGDSGTPLYNDDQEVIGVASSVFGTPDDGQYGNSFATLTPYWDFIVDRIDSLNASKIIEETYVKVNSIEPSYLVKVQNLTSEDKVISPFLSDGSYFAITANDCPTLLPSGDSCIVTLEAPRLETPNEITVSDVLNWGDGNGTEENPDYLTTISVSVVDELPVVDPCISWGYCVDVEDPPESPSPKSGGSVGFWLGGLYILLFTRRRIQTTP